MSERLSGRIVIHEGVIEGAIVLAEGHIEAIEPGAIEVEDLIPIAADSVARHTDNRSVACSTLAALGHAAAVGASIVDSAVLAATAPFRLPGLGDVTGAIDPGLRTNIMVLNGSLRIVRVVHG